MPTEPRSAIELVTKGSQEWRDIREMFIDAQAGQCAICRELFDQDATPHLDHCHATGFVRGALCASCNIKLGWLEKRRRAIEEYLSRAAEHAAYVIAPRTPRRVLQLRSRIAKRRKSEQAARARSAALARVAARTPRSAEHLRAYWQAKEFK